MGHMKTTAILASAALTALAIPFTPQPARIPLLLVAGWLIAQTAVLAHTWKHPLQGRAINWAVAGLAILTLIGSFAASAQASTLQLGIQDDGRLRSHDPTALFDDGHQMRAQWLRIISGVGEQWTAQKIRDAHAQGFKVILTVGGLGTRTRRPSFILALQYIQTLPKAERYTIANEPDLDGWNPCVYRAGWLKARRVLGQRLLWGDFSPHQPMTFTLKAQACGPLPKLDLAVHPYQGNDPLAPPSWAPWKQGGLGNLGHLKRILHTRSLWLTEFGYGTNWQTDERVAWLWPRAIRRAAAVDARILVIYTAKSTSWDTRPSEQAWAAIRTHV